MKREASARSRRGRLFNAEAAEERAEAAENK
jgi:hypothetical protein